MPGANFPAIFNKIPSADLYEPEKHLFRLSHFSGRDPQKRNLAILTNFLTVYQKSEGIFIGLLFGLLQHIQRSNPFERVNPFKSDVCRFSIEFCTNFEPGFGSHLSVGAHELLKPGNTRRILPLTRFSLTWTFINPFLQAFESFFKLKRHLSVQLETFSNLNF